MISKVSLNFITSDTDADFIVDSGRIISSLTGNASYPNPTPSLADIGVARSEFITSVNNLNTGVGSTVTRDEKRATLSELLRELSLSVQAACKGDLVVLLTSGFTAQKSRQPAGQLSAPANLRLRRPELSGQLKARCTPDDHAGSYQWRWATTLAPTVWTDLAPTLSASVTIENLTPGTTYIVQVRAIGTQGPSDWSDPAMLMAV